MPRGQCSSGGVNHYRARTFRLKRCLRRIRGGSISRGERILSLNKRTGSGLVVDGPGPGALGDRVLAS